MRGMIVRDMCATPSNWRSAVSVPEYLRAHGIVAIEGVDTRALVRHLRDNGSKMGIISTEIFDVDELAERLTAAPTLVGENLVKTVSCSEPHAFAASNLPAEHNFALAPAAPARHNVVAYDCGVKRGILEGLVRAGCDLTVVPWDTPASEVLDMNPGGVFIQRPRRPRCRGGDLRAGAAADRQGAGLWHLPWSPDDQLGVWRPNGKA